MPTTPNTLEHRRHGYIQSSGVSWGMDSVRLHPGGLRGAPERRGEKERSMEGREKRERKGAPKKERREGKGRERKYAKETEKREEIKRKQDIKRKTHGWRPVSDNRKKIKKEGASEKGNETRKGAKIFKILRSN